VTFTENLLEYINKGEKKNNEFFISDVLDTQMDITYGEDYEMNIEEETKNPEEQKE
jgi:hypothetical protein